MSFKRLDDDLNIIQNLEGSEDNNYGCTEEEMQAKFDEAANIIKVHMNEHMDELESKEAAKSIGYDGALGGTSHTVAEALDTIEQAGTGSIPPSNCITTDKIVNGAVTQEKLSESLNNRLDYLYGNLSKLLIQNGAEGEIEGSEDLLLFGINGELEEVYNLSEEKTEKWLDNYGNPEDNQTFTHTIVDAESTLNTNDVYNVTDEFTVHNTKLEEIKNAVLNLTTNSVAVTNSSYETVEVQVAYLGENYYAVATWGWQDYDDDKTHSKLFVIKYNEDSKELTIVHELAVSRQELNYSYLQVINGIAYCTTIRYGTDSDLSYVRKLSKDGISSSGLFTNYGYAGFANGDALFLDDEDSSTESIYQVNFNGTTRMLFAASDCNLYALSGYWAILKVGDTYSLYNVQSGSTKTITKAEYNSYSNAMRSQTLDTFYLAGYRYTIDDIGTITKHEFIENYVKGNYTYKISDTEELVYSGTENGSVYKIVRRGEQNSICVELFNTSSIVAEIQAENPAANPDHFTFNPNTNTLMFGIDFGRSVNAMVRVAELTKGTIKLATPIANTLNGVAKISREQKCTTPANQVKQIFIKPETEGNTYNAINLIVYLDRELAEDDELKVEILDSTGAKTEVSMLDSSSATTKYYNYSYSAATADIQLITTIKAGATELKATQILGGVDNAI